MVELKDISKSYGDQTVINVFNLTIEKGKITTFVGANGAGKSTLLNLIARNINSSSGQILIDGRDVATIRDSDMAKHVSFLRQSNHLNVKLTVRELVCFGRFPHSGGRLKKADMLAVDSALTYLGLDDIQHKYLDELSGGQRQRAYIAMVVAQDTDYILLDEPLNNLDMKYARQIMQTLRKLCDELGKTIVIVIHDINFASAYSDNIVAMKNGQIVKTGRICEIVQPDTLKEIFGLDFEVAEVNNCRVCYYYR